MQNSKCLTVPSSGFVESVVPQQPSDDSLLAAVFADADVEIDLNPAAPLPVSLYHGLNRSQLQLRSIRFSPVKKDCTEALVAAATRLSHRQCMSVLSVQRLRLGDAPPWRNSFFDLARALTGFSDLRSLALLR